METLLTNLENPVHLVGFILAISMGLLALLSKSNTN